MWRALLLFLALGVLDGVRSECNVCAATSNVACVSDTQFMFCQSGLPIQPVNTCPTGMYCASQGAVCQSDLSSRACSDCTVCNDLKNFACMSVRTFALCLGTSDPSTTLTGTCAPDYVCNKDNPNICGSASQGSQATCPLADDYLASTTEPGVPIDPNTYCRTMQQAGRFPYGNTLDTTCKQYILCYLNNSIWYGALYNCPGATYFHSTSKLCNSSIPATCSTRVSSLQVLNLRLL